LISARTTQLRFFLLNRILQIKALVMDHGFTISDGKLLSSNCDCTCCFNRPTFGTINGTSTRIDLSRSGQPSPGGFQLDTLAAGPNLLSTNASGTFLDIPGDDLNIGNILEHAANTGFGLGPNSKAWFVTFDGYDGCWLSTCGTNAYTMAYFFRDHLGATSAMGMDQGGSTTMFVAGEGVNGIVSTSSKGGEPRNIYNGLFLLQE
jgi:hypothetical protein